MPDLTVTIPEEKMAVFLTAIGCDPEGDDCDAKAEAWIMGIIRTQIWDVERYAAMNAVENPLPDP